METFEVKLRLDGVAEESRRIHVDFRRHYVLLAALAHLTRERLIGISERVDGDDGR